MVFLSIFLILLMSLGFVVWSCMGERVGGESEGEKESAVGWTLREGRAWKSVKFFNSSLSLESSRVEE